jgi:hypothetical protein
MQEPGLSWKPNWEETKGRLLEWWKGQGLAIGAWGAPQAGIEPGTHERWFPLYKRILDAGKSVQIMGGGVGEIEPVLRAIGGKGVYILAWFNNQQEVEQVQRLADKWR